jgi:hypothetical protein
MNYNKITREMVYLCIGDDIDLLDNAILYYKIFRGVKYFIIGNERVIFGESQVFCSCNERYCWHIFKAVLDKNKAIQNF